MYNCNSTLGNDYDCGCGDNASAASNNCGNACMNSCCNNSCLRGGCGGVNSGCDGLWFIIIIWLFCGCGGNSRGGCGCGSSRNSDCGCGQSGFGGDSSCWIIILLLFCCGGSGFGGNGGGCC